MRRPVLTPWFPVAQKPARSGVYKTKIHPYGEQGFAYYNANKQCWGWQQDTAQEAAGYPHAHGADQNKRWRGLAEEPKHGQ